METQQLVDIVRNDVAQFLSTNSELLFNERDLQMHLALYLRDKGYYDDVDLEYYVPKEIIQKNSFYPWDSEIRLDIVVTKDGEYLPIELKYKTRKTTCEISRFGEKLDGCYVVMKNQSAQNLGMYDFWKDVYRVEQVAKRFVNVKNGLAVFMTNDSSYMRANNEEANYYNFRMNEGMHDTNRSWLKGDDDKHPGFTLANCYSIHWETVAVEQIEFYYCMVQV